MSNRRIAFRLTLALLGFVIFTLSFAAGCRAKEEERMGRPPAYRADEVAVFVLIDPTKPGSLVVVPDSTYLIANKQKAHWIALQGDLTDIDFNVKKGGGSTQTAMASRTKPEKPDCVKVECTMRKSPTEAATFPYAVTLRLNDKVYRADPQLIVGD